MSTLAAPAERSARRALLPTIDLAARRVDEADVALIPFAEGQRRHCLALRAGEGAFELELPESRCDLLDGDSTVERIAEHLAARCAAQRPGRALQVRAYEGVMKGAVAEARA